MLGTEGMNVPGVYKVTGMEYAAWYDPYAYYCAFQYSQFKVKQYHMPSAANALMCIVAA